MVTRAEQLRAHADECDAWAGRVAQTDIQEQFRQIAGQWRRLAEQIEHLDGMELQRQLAAIREVWNAVSDLP